MAKKKEVEEIKEIKKDIEKSGVVILLEILQDKIKNRNYSKDELIREIQGIIGEVK